MSTKLEAMIGYLAGRQVEPKLLEELADPSSEASRFLEATRTRSRALLAEPEPARSPRPSRANRAGLIALAMLAIAAIVAFAATLRVVDRRFRLLESAFEARQAEARLDAQRIEAALTRLAEPGPEPGWAGSLEAALKQVEDRLARIEARPTSSPTEPNPSIAEAREQLAAIRRDLLAAEKGAGRRTEELQAAIHDAVRILKLLLNRFDPPIPVPAAGETRRP